MRNGRPAELVLGSVQLGLAYGAANRTGKPARETALRLVRRAANAGVAVFDTARAYGDAEERLGAALAGRNSVRTITKLAPLSELPPGASRETILAAVDKSIAESLTALRKTTLDCLLLHRADHISAFDGAVWQRLNEYLAEGRIAALGVSVQNPTEAHTALAQRSVSHIQLPFNLLDWRWREAGVIAALEARADVTVHIRSVYLQGLLTSEQPSIWPRIAGVDPPAVIAYLRNTATAFRRDGIADLALAYARGQGWVDGVVIGQETEHQLEDNLRLCTRSVLSPEDCASLEKSAPRLPEAFLNPAQWQPQ
jgi:aryl-alcohol dehydrogenase-like predicted oxidoreductase